MAPKRPRDPNQVAKAVIGIATGEIEDLAAPQKQPLSKSQAAELGGKQRAVSLTAKKRKEIAKKAAR